MTRLRKYISQLPSIPEELANFVSVGNEKLKARKAELRAAKKVDAAKPLRDRILSDAQDEAEMFLWAEARLGELLGGTERKPIRNTDPSAGGRFGGSKKTLPSNVTERRSYEAQLIAQYTDLIPVLIADARQRETFPTRGDMLRLIMELRRPKRKNIPPPIGMYRVLYADPPWQYSDSGVVTEDDNYGRATRHYQSLSIEELCEMGKDIKAITEDNAVLFMWATSPMLEDSFKVVKAWGFEYKTSFVWDKVKHNFGHYNSVRHEFLLVCTHGSCVPDVDTKYDSVVSIERSDEHSGKPDEFRNLIDTLYPHGNRVELFLRGEPKEGWDGWGNEAD